MPEAGKRYLVTGAASGIGLEITRQLLARRAVVVMTDLDSARLDAARSALGPASAQLPLIVGNLQDAADIERIADEAGDIDGLVNCAGIYPVAPLLELDAGEWDLVLGLNLRAPFLMTRAVARRMIAARRSGSIVNISSTASVLARPGIAHYGASKAGLNQLTRILAVELAPHGIRINAVLPGVIGTATVEASLTTPAAVAEMEAKKARIPMGRLGTADEIAEMVLFLLSDAASYATGSLLTADGGFSLGMARY